MIKNIQKTFFLSVLLALLISCSDKKVEKAITLCADTQVAFGNSIRSLENTFSKEIFSDVKYIKYSDELLALEKVRTFARKSAAKKMAKWEKENPRPKSPTYTQVQRGYTFNVYKKARDNWWKEKREKSKIYYKTSEKLSRRIKLYKDGKNALVRLKVAKILEQKTLQEKSSISNYNKKFTRCEKSYNETPRGFLLEWEKKKKNNKK